MSCRKREERLKAVAKRREEQARKEEEARKGMEQKEKEAKHLAAKIQDEKLKEEREKQKLRFVFGILFILQKPSLLYFCVYNRVKSNLYFIVSTSEKRRLQKQN